MWADVNSRGPGWRKRLKQRFEAMYAATGLRARSHEMPVIMVRYSSTTATSQPSINVHALFADSPIWGISIHANRSHDDQGDIAKKI